MRRIDLRFKLLAVTALTLTVWGAAVSLPFAFQAGDVISADQMNQNLAALNEGKQERVTGTCAAGSSIREIAGDGSVVCEIDDGAGASNEHDHVGQSWSGDVATALAIENVAAAGSPIGLLARSTARALVGVVGSGPCPGPYGVGGCAVAETGVRGISETGTGVRASSTTGIGMWATSDTRAVVGTLGAASCPGTYAVGGCTADGIGVRGSSSTGSAASFTGGSGGLGTCTYAGGAGWACTSDAALKEGFTPVDGGWVLDRLVAMPVTSWSMRGDASATPHVGPTAQDFHAAFGLGGDDTTINTADAQGVALAAIQGLHALVTEQRAQIEALAAEVAELLAR